MGKWSTKALYSHQSWTAWPSHLHFTGHSGEGLRISDCWYWQEEVLSSIWHHRGPVHVDHQEEDSTAIWEGHIPLCRQDCPTIQVRDYSLGIQNNFSKPVHIRGSVTPLFEAHLVILGDVCHILLSQKGFFLRSLINVLFLELGWKERWLKNILWFTSMAKGWALQLRCCGTWSSAKHVHHQCQKPSDSLYNKRKLRIKYSIANTINYSEKNK